MNVPAFKSILMIYMTTNVGLIFTIFIQSFYTIFGLLVLLFHFTQKDISWTGNRTGSANHCSTVLPGLPITTKLMFACDTVCVFVCYDIASVFFLLLMQSLLRFL